jgi:hypothetical protein
LHERQQAIKATQQLAHEQNVYSAQVEELGPQMRQVTRENQELTLQRQNIVQMEF